MPIHVSACARSAFKVAGAWTAVAALVVGVSVASRRPRGPASAFGPVSSRPANLTVARLIEKYGPPDRVEAPRLIWEARAPWKRLAVWDEPEALDDGRAARIIEATIAYAVPADKIGALASFSRALKVSPDRGELTATSMGEDRAFLLLNLADGIVRGRLTPADGRVSYFRTIRLADAGKSPPAMSGLTFRP